MKEFEVRAKFPGGKIGQSEGIFRVVRADTEDIVRNYFNFLCFSDIYIQEVPLSDRFTLELR